jgi:hypothetical protein
LHLEVHGKLLPLSSSSYYSEDARAGCLEGTRAALLQELFDWANDGAPGLTTLWLNGMAGTGKSAISTSFANIMSDEGLLEATFFVDRQVAERRDPLRIVQSLAYDLAVHDQRRLEALWSSLCANPSITDMPLRDQVRALIKAPLDTRCSESLVIVIDGLDECNPTAGAQLLSALVACLTDFPIKLFVASRSNSDMVESFGAILYSEVRLHQRPIEEVSNDVRLLWEESLDSLCRKRRLVDWRSIISIDVLVNLTGYLFIYATTVLKIIQKTLGSPITKLRELLELSGSGSDSQVAFGAPDERSPLHDLYFHVLTEAVKDNDRQVNSEYAVRLHDILEVVFFAREPLTASAVAELLEIDESELQGSLSTLLSVLVVPDAADELGVIRPFHQSFPDFALQQGKCVHLGLAIDTELADGHIAERSLKQLNKKLRFDICGIQDPSLSNDEVLDLPSRLAKHLPRSLRYGSRYWVVHYLQYIRLAPSRTLMPKGLEVFCRTHLLHWIEVLSLTRVFDEVRGVISTLLVAMKVRFASWSKRYS